jgi:hypothetical protein
MKLIINGTDAGEISGDVNITFQTGAQPAPTPIPPPAPIPPAPPPPVPAGMTLVDLPAYDWDHPNGVTVPYPLMAGQIGVIKFDPRGNRSPNVAITTAEFRGWSGQREIIVSNTRGNITKVGQNSDSSVQPTANFSIGYPGGQMTQWGYTDFDPNLPLYIHCIAHCGPEDNAEFVLRLDHG